MTCQHVHFTKDQIEEIFAQADAAKSARAEMMPTEADCLRVMMDAYLRLQELGWRDAVYCPKDGSWFDSISAGSTGIHDCQYTGEWPTGSWWVADGGDLWPARPVMFREKSKV